MRAALALAARSSRLSVNARFESSAALAPIPSSKNTRTVFMFLKRRGRATTEARPRVIHRGDQFPVQDNGFLTHCSEPRFGGVVTGAAPEPPFGTSKPLCAQATYGNVS